MAATISEHPWVGLQTAAGNLLEVKSSIHAINRIGLASSQIQQPRIFAAIFYWIYVTAIRYNVLGLQPNTTYFFYFKLDNIFGSSPPSNVSSFSTFIGMRFIARQYWSFIVATCEDGVCDTTVDENCATCPFDCGLCEYADCPGSCRHGTCEQGVCSCFDDFAGPECLNASTLPQPLYFTYNPKALQILQFRYLPLL